MTSSSGGYRSLRSGASDKPIPHLSGAGASRGNAGIGAETLGRWSPLTIFTPVPRWWAVWLRFNWTRVRLMALLRRALRRTAPTNAERTLTELSFVSFGHWAAFDRIPAKGGERLPTPYLLFTSNFNGAARQYFEAFSRTLTLEMRALWWKAYGPPDPLPAGPFADYILAHKIPADHYYCAYPDSSVKMILASLDLRLHYERFAARAPDLPPDEFDREFRCFLADIQEYL